jgi:tetratricopeptide (TPR) repeat protein
MEPGSKIYFNVGLIHATRGEHELAIEAFEKAIELDSYLAIAYFQAGVSRFLMKQYEEARRDFDDAWLVSLSLSELAIAKVGELILITLLQRDSTFARTKSSTTNSEWELEA